MAEAPVRGCSRPACSRARSASSPAPAAGSGGRPRSSSSGSAPLWSAADAATSRWRRPRELAEGAGGRLRARGARHPRRGSRSGRSSTACSSATAASTCSSTTPADSSSARPRRSRQGLPHRDRAQRAGHLADDPRRRHQGLHPAGRGKVLSVTLSPHNGMPGMVHSGAARAAVENMMRTLSSSGPGSGSDLRRRRRPVRHETLLDEVSAGGRRERRRARSRSGARPARGDGLADRLPRVAGRRLLLRHDDHDRRRARQLVGPWPPEAIANAEGGTPVAEERRPKPSR